VIGRAHIEPGDFSEAYLGIPAAVEAAPVLDADPPQTQSLIASMWKLMPVTVGQIATPSRRQGDAETESSPRKNSCFAWAAVTGRFTILAMVHRPQPVIYAVASHSSWRSLERFVSKNGVPLTAAGTATYAYA
jgi:hypothetical protein